MSNRKILMVLFAYYKDDPRVTREAEALSENNWDVTVVCLNKKNEPPLEKFNGVNIKRIALTRSTSRTIFSQMKDYLQFSLIIFLSYFVKFIVKKYDVVLIHNMPNFLVFTALPARLRGTPVVLDIHDSMIDVYANNFAGGSGLMQKLISFALGLEERISTSLATNLMTVNKPFEADLKARSTDRDIFIFHNTPDLRKMAVDRTRLVQFAPDQPTIMMYHGNMQERNGLQRIFPVMAKLNASSVNFRLDVHGRGEFYERIVEISEDYGLSSQCDFHGEFDHHSIVPYLENAHIGLVLGFKNRQYDLALPTKLLEYISCGIPVISQRLIATQFYFDEHSVNYFETEQDIMRVLQDIRENPEKARERANRAKLKLQEISFEVESAKLNNHFDDIVGRRDI